MLSNKDKRHYCDEQPLREWGQGTDGRPVKIDADERLPALYAEWQADACSHPATIVVCEPDSLERPQYFERCDHCGLKLSSAISHEKAKAAGISDRTREDVEALSARYTNERRSRYDAMLTAAAERCQGLNRQSYDDYLRSPAWQRRSAKIIERANGICEGCLTNPATEVHHMSYEHVGAEFAFELLALCGPCHRRWHSRAA